MSFHVRFRTGRDRYDSEARASAGTSENRESLGSQVEDGHPEASPARVSHPKGHRNVDRLHAKMQPILRGLQASDNTEELHLLLADASLVLNDLVAHYGSTETIRIDADALRSILTERHDRLLVGSVPRTRSQLKAILRRLKRVAPRERGQIPVGTRVVWDNRSLHGDYW